jgi:hypothetical protein
MNETGHRYRFIESAFNSFYLAIWHAADACILTKMSIWRPAAVSLYYSIYHLGGCLWLMDEEKAKRVLSREEGKEVSQDPRHQRGLFKHTKLTKFLTAHPELKITKFAQDCSAIKDLREFASYDPKIRLDESTGKTIIETSREKRNYMPDVFVANVRKYQGRTDVYLDEFSEFVVSEEQKESPEFGKYQVLAGRIATNRQVWMGDKGKQYGHPDAHRVADELVGNVLARITML